MTPIENQAAASFGLLICSGIFLFYACRYLLGGTDRDIKLGLYALVSVVGVGLFSRASYYEGFLISARYDLFVYRWDQLLRIGEPGFYWAQILRGHSWGFALLAFLYGLLPAAVTLALLVNQRNPWRAITAFAVNFALSPLVYAIFPVSGPLYTFRGFPAAPGVLTPHLTHSSVAPNGIPSVHMSTALLVCWYCRRSRSASIAAWIHLAGVVLSTLASGEHYVFDLVVAVPYAAFSVWVSAEEDKRSATARARSGDDDLELLDPNIAQ